MNRRISPGCIAAFVPDGGAFHQAGQESHARIRPAVEGHVDEKTHGNDGHCEPEQGSH